MGYSCSRDADRVLTVIGKMFATDGNPNILTIKSDQYFFERGKEQTDGAITGSLYRMLPNDLCRKCGTIRIEPNGNITRFPGLTRTDKEEAINSFRDMEARNPAIFHVW